MISNGKYKESLWWIVTFNVRYILIKMNLLSSCLFSISTATNPVRKALSMQPTYSKCDNGLYIGEYTLIHPWDCCLQALFSVLQQPWRQLAWALRRTPVRLALTSPAMKLQIWQCHSWRQFSLLETDRLEPSPPPPTPTPPPSCRSAGRLKTTKTRISPPRPDRSDLAAIRGTKWRWCSVLSGETRAKGKSSIYWRPKLTLSADVR